VQHVIDLVCKYEDTPDQRSFRHKLSGEIDGCVEGLFQKITRYFHKNKFEKHYPKDVSESLGKATKEATADLADVVFALESEIKAFKEQVGEKNNTLYPAGELWDEYYS